MDMYKTNNVRSNIDKINDLNEKINYWKKEIGDLEKQKQLLIRSDEQYKQYLERFIKFKDIIGSRLLSFEIFYKYLYQYRNCDINDEELNYLKDILLL